MWLKVFLAVLLLVVAAAAVVSYGASRWRAGTSELHARMRSVRARPGAPATYDPAEIADLPAPVQRYFRAVLEPGAPLVEAARIEHDGTFNMSEDGERWRPFTSRQHVVARRPGFVWDARIRMAPGVTVFVHDAYVVGRGILVARLYGLITVMRQPQTAELDQGELMRFLAEAAWYPTALLPSQGVRWEALGDERATAELSDGTTTVRLVFEFDAQGLIAAVRSEARTRTVAGRTETAPWEGRFRDYDRRGGMLVPLGGEVAWLLPEGPLPYWRGRIRSIEYEFLPGVVADD